MNEPRMAALLTASGRPGFYLRVLREGAVGAGDAIVKVGEGRERMSITEINALLYASQHPPEQLERALRLPALPAGWRASFEALRQSGGAGGNAGLAPAFAGHPTTPGFRSLEVTRIEPESVDVISLSLARTDGRPLAPSLPGQFVVLRLHPAAGAPLHRSYSLSGPPSMTRYRVSAKVEPHGAAGTYLKQQVRVGDRIEVSAPRGKFVLQGRRGAGGVAQRRDWRHAGAGHVARAGGERVAARGVVAAWRAQPPEPSVRRREPATAAGAGPPAAIHPV